MFQTRTDTASSTLEWQRLDRHGRRQNRSDQTDLNLIAGFHAQLTEIQSRTSRFHEFLGAATALLGDRPAVVGTLSVRRTAAGQVRIASHTLDQSEKQVQRIGEWLLPRATESLAKGLPVSHQQGSPIPRLPNLETWFAPDN